jgi:cell division septation protein DedD
MRLLILLVAVLILGNAVAYLLPTEAEVNNLRYTAKPDINPEEVRFLLEEIVANQDTISVSEEVESSIAQQSTAMATQEIATQVDTDSGSFNGSFSGDESASTSESQSPQETAQELSQPSICYRIGPFLREARLESAKTRLSDELQVESDVLTREPIDVVATRVYIGPFADAAIAKNERIKLTEQGIADHFTKREDSGYVVSLGIYSNTDSAQKLQVRFQNAGVNAKTRTESTRLPKSYWIQARKAFDSQDLFVLSRFSWGESSVSLSKNDCTDEKSI